MIHDYFEMVMHKRFLRTWMVVAALVALAATAHGQEGHPMTGTWYGEMGTGAARKDLTLVMKWDGSKVSGTVNPGPGAASVSSVTLDIIPGKAGTFSLNNPEGTQPIPPVFNVKITIGDVVLEGRMQNPVGGNRSISGTYTRGSEKGPFQIKRL
jgi:hypothetical protein